VKRDQSVVGGPNYGTAKDDVPVTCVGLEQATRHCAWLGGKLPTLDEWLLAARGSGVRKHSWGDAAATCEQHPLGQVDSASGETADEMELVPRSCGDSLDELYQIAQHPAGASPSGVQDVLLSRGELARSSENALFAPCSEPRAGCVVYGLSPGSIDSVEPVEMPGEHAEKKSGSSTDSAWPAAESPYAYRCVWEEES
jgi:hypothetical protein